MSITTLRDFQRRAVEEGAAPLLTCLERMRQARQFVESPEEQAEFVRENQGCLLINAPTGIGKTLIAGSIAQTVSASYPAVWMWFAPFSGIVEQTVSVIRREFSGLHPLDIANERNPVNLRKGDVFVCTWASVAARNAVSRGARRDNEKMPSIDSLLEYARAQGMEVCAVIDEMHHGFRHGTEALNFCRDVLKPSVSVMITATPRETEIKTLAESLGAKQFHEISISRQTGVEENLLKRGVKVAVFRATAEKTASAVDFKRVALVEAVKEHKEIQATLKKAKIEISPLLMVQADESEDGVEKAKKTLIELGIPDNAVRVHTADEPDPEFLRIAEDESVEALVFKMAAATGFDAPRAFVLASLRRIRDENFGVQVIGRIMRKHRAHQAAEKPPEYLDYGYVFLADAEAQEGLLGAAARISAVQDEIKTLTNNIGVVVVGGTEEMQDISKGPSLFSQWKDFASAPDGDDTGEPAHPGDSRVPKKQSGLPGMPPADSMPQTTSGGHTIISAQTSEVSHALRSELAPPKRFATAVFNTDKAETITRDVVDWFKLENADIIALANKAAADVCKETLEIFKRSVQTSKIQADLAYAELARMAQQKLGGEIDPEGYLHEREFKKLFQARLAEAARNKGWNTDEEYIHQWMIKILAERPKELRRAVSEVIARNLTVKDAGDLPPAMKAETPLRPSALNLYGVYPADLNSWELKFAEKLDSDTEGVVKWWHRNLPWKKWAVSIPLAGHGNYFPDFVVGVNGRQTDDNILLVETKRDINDVLGLAAAKSRSEHPSYGRVRMLLLDEQSNEWATVEYNHATGGNTTTPGFHLGMMRS